MSIIFLSRLIKCYESFYGQATLKEYADKVQACLTEDRAARDSVKSKRQEMDSVQFVINKVKNAMSVEDIDGRVYLILLDLSI